jgi:hypothetical protein
LSFFMICAMVTQALTFALWTTDSMWYVAIVCGLYSFVVD